MTRNVSTEPAGPRQETIRPGPVVALCFCVSLFEGFDLQVIGVAGPLVSKALALDPEQLGLAFAASLVGLALGAIFAGRLADQIGRKPLLLLSTGIFGLLTLATSLSWDLGSLIVFRFLTGLGLGGAMPNAIAIVAETVRRTRATLAVAAITCGLSAGGILAAQVTYFLAAAGWQRIFVIGGVLPLILLPALLTGLPETKPERGGAAPAGSFADALFGEGRAAMTLVLWLVFGLTLLQLSLLLNWLPLIVIAKGFPRESGFLAAMVFNLGGIAGSLTIGWLCDRMGATRPLLASFLIVAAGYVLLSASHGVPATLAVCAICGFVVLGAQYALYGVLPQLYRDGQRGSGVGAAVAVGRIGAIIGPVLAGVILGSGRSAERLMLLLLPLVALAVLAMAVLGRVARPHVNLPTRSLR